MFILYIKDLKIILIQFGVLSNHYGIDITRQHTNLYYSIPLNKIKYQTNIEMNILTLILGQTGEYQLIHIYPINI